MVHIIFDCLEYKGSLSPKDQLEQMEIFYQIAVEQKIMNQWWFFAVDNLPEELPEYISIAKFNNLTDLIGEGLDKSDVEYLQSLKT